MSAKDADAGRGADAKDDVPDELSPPAVSVLRKFRLVFNTVKAHFQKVEKQAGIGGAQLWALSLVHAHPAIGVSDLARAMDIHQSTASNLVRALAERKLVAAERGASDRRSVQLTILPAGRRLLQRAPGPFTGILPNALASLDARTLARLDKDLAALLAVLNADERAARIPLGE
jgi:DNA-binding MarR family transcriptional regulator